MTQDISETQRERLLRALSAATFVIFFQAFMGAPLIPRLAETFAVSPQEAGLIVPAYLLPYAVATLVYGLLADRFGVWRIMVGSLAAFSVLTAMTATARWVEELALWRAVTALGAGGVVPLALTLVGRLFPYERRGRALGWLFGAMAGGMAFGSTFGAVLEPFIGWRGIFVAVGGAGAGVLLFLIPHRHVIGGAGQTIGGGLGELFQGYRSLLATQRGARTYGFVFVNSIFHSGVFTWLGLYFEQRYGLGPVGIGLALLGYGVPGFLFGPAIGYFADRYGRARAPDRPPVRGARRGGFDNRGSPLVLTVAVVTLLSLGYDMTQPLFAGIVTLLGGKRAGQAMGLNVLTLFIGFGLGSLLFGELLRHRFGMALGLFGGRINPCAAVLLVVPFRGPDRRGRPNKPRCRLIAGIGCGGRPPRPRFAHINSALHRSPSTLRAQRSNGKPQYGAVLGGIRRLYRPGQSPPTTRSDREVRVPRARGCAGLYGSLGQPSRIRSGIDVPGNNRARNTSAQFRANRIAGIHWRAARLCLCRLYRPSVAMERSGVPGRMDGAEICKR